MNTFNKSVIEEIRHPRNVDAMKQYLNAKFKNQTVRTFLDVNFATMVNNACERYERELSVSDPVPGSTVYEQASAFTNQLINDAIGYIGAYVLGDENGQSQFTICDGDPTSRSSLGEHQRKMPDEILASWNKNAGSVLSGRDDSQYGNAPANEYAWNAKNTLNQSLSTGVTVSDQRDIGQNQYYDQLFNPAFHALNKGRIAGGIYGDWSPEADERMLSRRIFRDEAGTENGIPFYNRTVNKRHVDRDITQNLRQGEYDYKLYKHDVSDLYARADMRKASRYSGGASQYC